jgi:hypothetical protein
MKIGRMKIPRMKIPRIEHSQNITFPEYNIKIENSQKLKTGRK